MSVSKVHMDEAAWICTSTTEVTEEQHPTVTRYDKLT